MNNDNTQFVPKDIRVAKDRSQMTLVYGDETSIVLEAEYLRISSQSAEVVGHGPGQEITQHGKRNVKITGIEAVGRYAIRIIFSDGHDTGIYRWDFLKLLADEYDDRWTDYLEELNAKNLSRDTI